MRETEREEIPMTVGRGDDDEGNEDVSPDEDEERQTRRIGLIEGKKSGKGWDGWKEELKAKVGERADTIEFSLHQG